MTAQVSPQELPTPFVDLLRLRSHVRQLSDDDFIALMNVEAYARGLIVRLDKSVQELVLKCVNAHDLCYGGALGPCELCEPVVPLRATDGRFVSSTGEPK